MSPPQPGQAYTLRAWYGWMGLTIRGPNGESSISTNKGPEDHGDDDHHEDGHDDHVRGGPVLLTERIEAHGGESSAAAYPRSVLSQR